MKLCAMRYCLAAVFGVGMAGAAAHSETSVQSEHPNLVDRELYLLDVAGTNYVLLQAPSTMSGNVSLVLPSSTGSSGQVLQTDGTGVLSWSTVANNPISAQGDLIVGGAGSPAAPTRLGIGTNGQYLRAGSPTVQYGWQNVHSVTSAYSITTDGYDTILANTTTAAFTVTLPPPASNSGRVITIKKTDSSANNLTISPNATETIDGASSNVLHAQFSYVTLLCDGTNWDVLGTYDYLSANATSTTLATSPTSIANISLTPGVWTVSGMVQSAPTSSPASNTTANAVISTSNNAIDSSSYIGTSLLPTNSTGGGAFTPTPNRVLTETSTSSVYLVGDITGTLPSGTWTTNSIITATRSK